MLASCSVGIFTVILCQLVLLVRLNVLFTGLLDAAAHACLVIGADLLPLDILVEDQLELHLLRQLIKLKLAVMTQVR